MCVGINHADNSVIESGASKGLEVKYEMYQLVVLFTAHGGPLMARGYNYLYYLSVKGLLRMFVVTP
jgi:hypothetical protein